MRPTMTEDHERHRRHWGHTRAGMRVAVGFSCGLIAWAAAALLMPWQTAVLVGWSTAALVVVVWILGVTWPKDGEETAKWATREDDSRTLADLLLMFAAVASLVAVGLALIVARDAKGAEKAAITALVVVTVVLSWAVVHLVYMLRYAHMYYSHGGGVDFNDDRQPDYRDFAYLALTLGMTFQVSDTDLTNKIIRQTATRHALLSYLFGAVVIALVINVVAGLSK
jgi:uncharacterized membrane protein